MSTLTNTTTSTELAVRLRRTVVRLSRRLRRHAAIEDVKRPTATRLIAILERRNLVERAADPCDGRSHRVAVTHAGRALLADSRTRRDAYLGRALSALEPDEYAEVVREVGKFRRIGSEIDTHKIDLASVNAAAIIDHPKICGLGVADRAVFRKHACIRHDVADLDFGVRCARVVAVLRKRRRRK